MSVLTVTGPITDSKDVGGPPSVTSLTLVPGIRSPARAKPPKLSFTKGCVNEPPPQSAILFAKIVGNEFCCAAKNTVPSEKPAVNEFPKET